MKIGYLKQAWLVLTLALGFGGALAGVEVWLRPRIEANKLEATIKRIPKLVDGASASVSAQFRPEMVTVGEGAARTTYEVFWAISEDAQQMGWVVHASGKGFADTIELLIGLDPSAEEILGVSILDQKETPGLGNEIADVGTPKDKGFLWQFYHYGFRADEPLVVTTASPKITEGNRVKAVTGATISSKAVAEILNDALSKELRRKLSAARGRGPVRRDAPAELEKEVP